MTAIHASLDTGFDWTPNDMTPEYRARLSRHRAAHRARSGAAGPSRLSAGQSSSNIRVTTIASTGSTSPAATDCSSGQPAASMRVPAPAAS